MAERIFVKLCGLTTPAEVEEAARLDVDALGFVIAKDARVPLRAEEASLLCAPLRGSGILGVAVTGLISLAEAERLARLGFDVLQTVYDRRAPLPRVVGDALVLPVLFDGKHAEEDAEAISESAATDGAMVGRLVCLDGSGGGQRGERPNWSRAARIAEKVPLLLAGGLTPETVRAAITEVGPRGVDVSSGISGPDGRKDPGRMRAFVAAVREAERESSITAPKRTL